MALARLVNSLKGVSSRLLRKEFPELDGYCQDAWLWSGSYYAGTGTGTPATDPGHRRGNSINPAV